MGCIYSFLLFLLLICAGNALSPDLSSSSLSESSKGSINKDLSLVSSTNNSEQFSELSALNSIKFDRILSAESTCSRKLQGKYQNCCSFIVSAYEIEQICNRRHQEEKSLNESSAEIERELSEIRHYYDYHCNDTDYKLLIANNITLDDIYDCMRYNGMVTNNPSLNLEKIKLDGKESTIEEQRALQLTSWMNHFGLPSISSNTILSQSRFTEGSFLHTGGGQNCSPLLTLIFVRVCNSICNSHHDSSSGRSSIPIFCLRDCQPFAKFACLRGCRTFGCSVDIYTCMELMCQ